MILPLIVYLIKKDENAEIARHAKEAFNFHLSMTIYAVVGLFLSFFLIGIPMLIAIGFGSLILAIMATIRAAEDKHYRYPLTIRFL